MKAVKMRVVLMESVINLIQKIIPCKKIKAAITIPLFQ